ncbi:MAG TPA: DUF1697 domain-containing protein [Thermoanaerobaculia bacterium]|nr:DUF1697 domain-containing protein [Thermoanaerobaculia bacterium]
MAAKDVRVALIRGINVGKAKRVAMAELRAELEKLGYGDVRTLLNSGNVVFSVPAKSKGDPVAHVEEVLEKRLRVPAKVVVLTGAEVAEAIDGNPLLEQAESDPARFLVAALAERVDRKALATLAKQDWAPDAFALGKRVAYLWCADGILASKLLTAFNRATGDGATTRNWTTMVKLRALAES